VRVLSVNGAADALGGSQNFLAGSLQLTGHGPGPHHAGDGQNVFEANVSTVLDCKLRISAVNRGIKHRTIQCIWAQCGGSKAHDSPQPGTGIGSPVQDCRAILTVLLLLAVTWGFLQSLDDQRGGGGNHGDGGLSVLDGQADGDLQTLPVGGGLGDVITDFLGRLQRDTFVSANCTSKQTDLHAYQTEGTDLWGQGGCGTDFSAHATQVHCNLGAEIRY